MLDLLLCYLYHYLPEEPAMVAWYKQELDIRLSKKTKKCIQSDQNKNTREQIKA